MENKLKTVDAETLLSTPMSKTMFIVDNLIPQGVNVISGASKIGKSWLMLWLGLQVAQGLPVWGLTTQQCDVLYLSLEDTQRRIKDRLYTTGIIGAADTSYVLMKEKITDDVAKFYVRGRDVEEQVLTIKFNPESKEWIFVSSNSPIADAMKNDKVISLLINFIKKQTDFIGTASELASTLGGETKANVLTRRLSRYKNELADMGITFEKSRSGERRELKINYKPDDDMTVMTDS